MTETITRLVVPSSGIGGVLLDTATEVAEPGFLAWPNHSSQSDVTYPELPHKNLALLARMRCHGRRKQAGA